MSESLALELAPFGICVLIVEPGAFRSNFLGAYIKPAIGMSDAYKGTAVETQMDSFAGWSGKQPGNVAVGCQRIFEVITDTGMGRGMEKYLRLGLGSDWASRGEGKIRSLVETKEALEPIWKSTDYKDE